MAQAQKLEKEIMNIKAEINNTVFVGESQLVKVRINGRKELISVEILKEKELSVDDIELLEDMIIIASKECYKKIEKITDEKLGKYGPSLSGLI